MKQRIITCITSRYVLTFLSILLLFFPYQHYYAVLHGQNL